MRQVILIIPFLALLVFSGCKKPTLTVSEGELVFSSDTVRFDTIFSNFDSPTERLLVTNPTNNNLKIRAIYLEDGSSFDLIFDGRTGDRLEDYILAKGDSAVAFITFKSNLQDDFARDRLIFELDNQTYAVDLEAYLLGAEFFSDDTLENPFTVFTPDKRYLIDGCLWVPQGSRLVIEAGTEVYFTSKLDTGFNLTSAIKVQGTLEVRGEPGNEVVFTSTRFGERYEESPGQWRGLLFDQTAENCVIRHAVIKNGLIGVGVFFATNGIFPKVKLQQVEIRNMEAFGIMGYGYSTPGSRPMIQAENCLVHNCELSTFRTFGGGQYEFLNCTFANYSVDFNRQTPQFILNNYDPDDLIAFQLDARFRNCIIWGSEEDEIGPDTALLPDIYNVEFNHCIARTTLTLKGFNTKISQDNNYPVFGDPTKQDPAERDYRFLLQSPALNAGEDLSAFYGVDLSGNPRDQAFDIGAYEF